MPASAEVTISREAAEITKNEKQWPVVPRRKKIDQRGNGALEADAPAGFRQMLAPHPAKLRVMADQIGQLATLLHKIAAGKPGYPLLKSRHAQHFAQYNARIVKTQRLVEIRSQQVVLKRYSGLKLRIPWVSATKAQVL